MLVFWIFIFLVSLAVMVKGADWFLDGAEHIGLAAGLSPFIVGVVIVGLGTSFPELISSLIATFRGVTEIVTANAVGSNIANILLVIGLSAIVGKRLTISKSLIDLDIPLLAITTALFLGVVWDGVVTLPESLFLIVAYGIYLAYAILHKDDEQLEKSAMPDILPGRPERRGHKTSLKKKWFGKTKFAKKDFIFLIVGLAGLTIGAKYLIDSVIALSELLSIGAGAITLFAVAFGTSLPELLVAVKAAWKKKPDVALGSIFGSNVFNLLIVVGVPGLFKTLTVDSLTLTIGVPTLIVATVIFIISGISRRIHIWEGFLYLLLYLLFVAKLFDLF